MSVLIKNAIIVNASGQNESPMDILIEHDKIVKVATNLKDSAERVIDAQGQLVMPGLMDIHVHLRTPGQEHKETIETGSKAAAKGGFTSIFCMPNTNPIIDEPSIVRSIIEESKRVGLVNVYPIGAITKGQKDQSLVDMIELKEAGCIALSDDGKSVENSQLMRMAMEYSRTTGQVLIQHCEDPLISAGGVMNESVVSTRLGLKGHSPMAESIIVARDIELAAYLNVPVHLAHMSLKRCVDLIRQAKAEGIPVTAEVCPHHFTLTDEAVQSFDTRTKMNPPLRRAEDVEALKIGLADGTIDCIVTDHAPHTKEEKELSFDQAPFGIIGLETSVGLTITELVKPGVLSWPQMVKVMSYNPAQIMGLSQKGEIKAGLDADITIIDPNQDWVVREADIVSKSKNTPFIGRQLTGAVVITICAGRVVYEDQAIAKKGS